MPDYNRIAQRIGSFLEVDDWAQAFAKKGSILRGNEAINPIPKNADGMMSGIPRAIYNMRHTDQGFVDAVKTAHSKPGGGLDYGTIAGSYLAASSAYRIASGGGLTRDAEGNPNIIGIPFV